MAQEDCLYLLSQQQEIGKIHDAHLCEWSFQLGGQDRHLSPGKFIFLMIFLNIWGTIYRENIFYTQILHAL